MNKQLLTLAILAFLAFNSALSLFVLAKGQQRQTQTAVCKQLGGHLVEVADGYICAKLTVIPLEVQKP